MWTKYLYYLNWGFRTLLRKRKIPLNCSLILTDECNLDCRHCVVSNLGYPRQSLREVKRDIRVLYETGARVLVLTGGEPFLWKDDEGHTLEDVVSCARKAGFFRIVVCTNGTHRLESSADYLWVSLDGAEEKHNFIRGDIYSLVLRNIMQSGHKGIHINFTISRNNLQTFPADAERILAVRNVKGILFHLYTQYVGGDASLVLEEKERVEALRQLRNFKIRHPVAVFNTFAGIAALRRDEWERNTYASVTINRGVLSQCCCRVGIYDEDVCRNCGCTPAVETWVLQTFKPSAIIENLRYI